MSTRQILIDAMARKGLTQAALANLVGVSQPAVCKWLALSGGLPSPKLFPKIAKALGLRQKALERAYLADLKG